LYDAPFKGNTLYKTSLWIARQKLKIAQQSRKVFPQKPFWPFLTLYLIFHHHQREQL
jgi:hypothetical protein